MQLGLKDSRIVITGGASHIGRAIVSQLAAEGAAIAIIDIDKDQAERTAALAMDLGAAETHVVAADLTDLDAAGRACQQAMQKLRGIGAFISNAGSNRPDFFLKLDPAVKEVLASGYPRDEATGFAEGDLRGWFWIEVPKP